VEDEGENGKDEAEEAEEKVEDVEEKVEEVEDEEGASRTNVSKVDAAVTVDRKPGKRMLSCAAPPLRPAIVPEVAISDIAMQGQFGKGCKH